MFLKNFAKQDAGFTLVEGIVSIGLIAVISSIAFAVTIGGPARATTAVATADAGAFSMSVSASLLNYTDLGSGQGSISLDNGNLTIVMLPAAAAPIVVTTKVNPSANTAINQGTIQGSHWCFRVANKGNEVVATEEGIQQAATTCLTDGTAS